MRHVLVLNSAVCLTLASAGFVQAADLNKLNPPLVKEPAYQSKAPKYALLVFGPDARTPIWLVLDGETLFVDRNGNGDLTEDGEKIARKKGTLRTEDAYSFAIGELRAGDRRHLNATLSTSAMKPAPSRSLQAQELFLSMEVDLPGCHGSGEGGRVLQMAGTADLEGQLQWSDRPQDAPILHFAGPWTIALSDRPTFRVNREVELYLVLGTPGRGKGTFVSTAYEGVVPRDVYPRAEITFPSQKPGEPPLKMACELTGRC